jgi:hypothetical protein
MFGKTGAEGVVAEAVAAMKMTTRTGVTAAAVEEVMTRAVGTMTTTTMMRAGEGGGTKEAVGEAMAVGEAPAETRPVIHLISSHRVRR